tara:strand:- start:248 stop:433 length:186 start_codon:yes stop_codon:yes gene_type:complete
MNKIELMTVIYYVMYCASIFVVGFALLKAAEMADKENKRRKKDKLKPYKPNKPGKRKHINN